MASSPITIHKINKVSEVIRIHCNRFPKFSAKLCCNASTLCRKDITNLYPGILFLCIMQSVYSGKDFRALRFLRISFSELYQFRKRDVSKSCG